MAERRPLVRNSGRVGQLPPGDTVPADTLPSNVSALAALIGAANKIAYFTGPGAMNLADFTVFARLWCALADAGAGRTLLELGTSATRNATTSATDTTSERLWRTNDLVKTTSAYSTTVGSMTKVGDYGWGIGQQLTQNANFNDYSTPGIYFLSSTGAVNAPVSATGLLTVTAGSFSGNNTRVVQEYNAYTLQRKFVRNFNGSVWSTDWDEYWSTVNFDPDLKANLVSPTFTGTVVLPPTTSVGSVSSAELGYLDGVTSPIQTQIDAKAALASPTFTGTPAVPTASAGTNTTQAASTAFATSKTKVVTTRSATSYTFVLGDNVDIYNRFTNAGASTCTVPPNSSVPYPIGHCIIVRRAAAANLTLTPGSGVTLNAPSGGTLVMTNNMTAELIKVATDTWDVVGQTVAV